MYMFSCAVLAPLAPGTRSESQAESRPGFGATVPKLGAQ